ncbi:hypothetical protein POVWA1_012270 [Plasmodium ovale wallikeri]|uniref:Uncharacterized protein n=1 Tax=Plasmodium ovale wallikeri TaxID=864142 RepID=A0A1A8YM73_PLAOA|nr:hypothetical protein POVWA1_012270 [Plasmodium ovale wallikeri]
MAYYACARMHTPSYFLTHLAFAFNFQPNLLNRCVLLQELVIILCNKLIVQRKYDAVSPSLKCAHKAYARIVGAHLGRYVLYA